MADQIDQQEKSSRVFFHRTPPGSVPGSMVSDPKAPFPELHILAWSDGDFVDDDLGKPGDIRAYLQEWPLLWVNVDGLGDVKTLQEISEIFGFHKLAMEDVVHVHQRSKMEEYGDNLFIVIRMPYMAEGRISTEQLSIFLGSGFVLTFQEKKGDCLEPVRERVRKGKGRIRNAGADYLAYAILDAVVDSWFPLLEEYGVMLESMEEEVLENPTRETVGRIHSVKRDLLEVRRTVWPMRETINNLLRDEDFFQRETNFYLRDCYDHVIQIIDLVESYRDMASSLMELYLSSISNRMNEVMKVLTIIATIFIPLTFIAGIYGMNFNPEVSSLNMPELNWKYGYLFVWALMGVVGCLMLLFFRKLGWIGSSMGQKGGKNSSRSSQGS